MTLLLLLSNNGVRCYSPLSTASGVMGVGDADPGTEVSLGPSAFLMRAEGWPLLTSVFNGGGF